MPAHDAPLSLEELLAQKRNKPVAKLESSVKKTRFIPKSERAKLEKKNFDVKIDASFPKVGSSKVNNQKNVELSQNSNFDEDPENTEEPIEPIEILVKQQNYDYSLDLPHRKKRKLDDDFSGLHWSMKPLDKMTERDWRIMKEDFNIHVSGKTEGNLLRSWNESKIPEPIIESLYLLGMKEPSPIQRATIPLGMEGRDVLGLAETGSGKTLAFLIPALSYVMNLPPVRSFESPYVLIIVPTRELAQQIEVEFQKFKNLRINIASIVGGHTYDDNLAKLEKGVEILVGTPGRLLDLIEKKIISLDQCFFLVADEADRMIDMGFEKQVESLIDALPSGDLNPFLKSGQSPKRLTLMFTATMPPQIEKLITNYMTDPITVKVGDTKNAVDTVVQETIQIASDEKKRMSALLQIIKKYPPPIIVFVNFQKLCDILYAFLHEHGYNPVVIHGGRTQAQRETAISDIRSGRANILVATDVAARGIDIPNVSLVVNFQMTKTISEYVHRIGRTGRAGRKGTAITFWDGDDDASVLYDLKTIVCRSKVSNCPKDLMYHPNAKKISDQQYIEN